MNPPYVSPRRMKATIGPLAVNQLHYSNPWVLAMWSFFFPGFGHLMLGQHLLGWILFAWEMWVNIHAHFNVAIIYTLTGRADLAKQVLATNHRWIVLYGAVFVYSIWSSYQLAVETNNLFYLANRENAQIKVFEMNAFQYTFVDKRNPWTAAIWSLLMPGLGDLYNRRLPSAMFTLAWWVVICIKANVLLGVVYSFTGHFHEAVLTMNPEWFMFLPSIYGFAFHDAYLTTLDRNTLFDKEQANFLAANYQSLEFNLNLGR